MIRTLALLLTVLVPPTVQAQTCMDGLGCIDFPNSGAPGAQEAFHRGVLLLHSFEFGPAAEAFREARAIDPGFALAYWGEAMTHNHPLWREVNVDAARRLLSELAPTPGERAARAGTDREAGYIRAVDALYGEGAKTERDRAYMDAMEDLHAAHPGDREAEAFYALSILGSQNGERDFATYMRAAAVALRVFENNPRHPGAAHYIIHSFDDPVHAPLGLPAADAYSGIAPDAAHAQHMTSHIFVAMGLWDRVVEANINASRVQDAERAESGMGPNVCGHYSSWLHYGRLMKGELEEAETLMDACHARVTSGSATGGEWSYFVTMRARHVVDTADWALAGRWTADPPAWSDAYAAEYVGVYGGPAFTYGLTDAVAALRRGDPAPARAMLETDWAPSPGRSLQLDQLRGLLAIADGRTDDGLDLLAAAAEAEDALPFEYGPPEVVVPTFELLGQELDRAGRPADVRRAYRRAADRTPGRAAAEGGPGSAHANH
jgi:hypothetical protein